MNIPCGILLVAALAAGVGKDIRTATVRPADFDAFWDGAVAALDRDVPEDAQCVHDPSLDSPNFTGYRVSFATYGKGRRVYGFVTVPKHGKGPWPVRIRVPGAGPGSIGGDKATGCVSLFMNVHDFEPRKNPKEQYAAYMEENERWGKPYGVKWYYQSGIQKSREDYFYYGAILGINRAVNWLVRQPYVDRREITYRGQSQGGAFGIYLSALNTNITAATISEPALTDTLAFRQKRQSGWPTITEIQPDKSPGNLAKIAERMAYFDTVSFVPRIKCPTRWLAGWSDGVCPGPCVHAGYNELDPSTDHAIVTVEDCGHGVPSDVYPAAEKLLTASWLPDPEVWVGTDPVDSLAADEFCKYYELMTGRKPFVAAGGGARSTGNAAADSVVRAPRPHTASRPVVRIGKSLAGDLAFDAKFDSYRILSKVENDRPTLLLAGGNARSTMYAVYEFFKLQGCRWFWDGDALSRRGAVDLAGYDIYEVSAFEYRATRYFAHRGLRRFSAEMWGPKDWRREIDWLLKNRLNLFFFRLGMDDLFQKAFPEYCKYPDASKPLPGQLEGYDNRSLFWSLEYRGALRKDFTDYAFARGLMIPPDFGTITHWYTRTPEDFLKGAQPDFLPEPKSGYAAHDSGKVWDVRQDKWMEAYWKLTEAEIANYGRTPGPLHTIGFSERNLFTNRTENLAMKRATTKRMFDRALKAYPDATILFAGWDFYSTWTPEELKGYWPTLDPKHVVVFDYEANAYRPPDEIGRMSDLTKWDLVGKFPYTFGTFFYESGTPIHTDYGLIAERRKAVEGDPMCRGTILWPEASHVDILEQRHFTDNAWRFTDTTTEKMIDRFATDRYGRAGWRLADIWKKVVPLSVKCAGKEGPWRANYADLIVNTFGRDWPLEHAEDGNVRTVGLGNFRAAPDIFRSLAQVDWTDDFVRRDTIDLARTVADRLILELACGAQSEYLAWRDGKGGTPAAALAKADRALSLVALMGDLLALHADFSLAETLEATDAIEKIKLPNFDEVLVQNAVNGYCCSHQYEPAAHLYPQQYAAWRAEMARRFADTAPGAKMTGTNVAALLRAFWQKPLRSMRPTLPRTPENYRKTMLALAEASARALATAH